MKNDSVNSIFKFLCEKYDFQREKNSAKKQCSTFDLYLNLQNSGSGKYFYINVIVLYPELIEDAVEFSSNQIFSTIPPFFPHISFRIECLMRLDGIDQRLYDELYANKDWHRLGDVLDMSFQSLIHHSESGDLDRINIRNAIKNGVVSAIIRKDV